MSHRAVVHDSSGMETPTPVGGPLLLRLQLFAMLGLPAYMVLEPAGASGSVTQLLAMALTGLWLASALLGKFDAWETRHPGRVGVACWVMVSCLSYASLMAGLSGISDPLGRSSADRWLLLVFAGAGLTLSVTQSLRTREDVRRAVGWLMAGASVGCAVAVVQFTTLTNPLDALEPLMLGFVDSGSATPFQSRGTFARVAGTTMHPIELGVVCSMLLPLSVWWGLYSTEPRRGRRWAPAVFVVLGTVVTVSRSAMLGLVVAIVVMIPYLPKGPRRWALVLAPVGLAALFVAVPGMISTLFGAVTAGTGDPSIEARTTDYPLAWSLLVQRPVLGYGPGTWMPVNAFDIFDNQFLLTAVTMGVAGVVAMVAYLMLPAMSSLLAAKHASDPELRLLSASVAAALLVALVSSAAFDSMSFTTFAFLVPFFVGLAGTAWLLTNRQLATTGSLGVGDLSQPRG